jgi:2-oxoisovalerate dehydrogenase E2 component (dihydrolipoyl transacylase)
VGQTLCEIKDEEFEGTEPYSEGEETRDIPPSNTQNGPEDTTSEPIQPVAASNPIVPTNVPVDQTQDTSTSEAKSESDLDILLSNRDIALDLAGTAQFTGEAAILPSPPSFTPPPSQSTSIPIPRRNGISPSTDGSKEMIRASPAVRTLAARLGVDLSEVEGSGEDGRITREDVERATTSQHIPMNGSVSTDIRRDSLPEITRVEFGRTRKAMWKGLSPQGSIPHFG